MVGGKPCLQKRDQEHDNGRDALHPHRRAKQATATTGRDGILASLSELIPLSILPKDCLSSSHALRLAFLSVPEWADKALS